MDRRRQSWQWICYIGTGSENTDFPFLHMEKDFKLVWKKTRWGFYDRPIDSLCFRKCNIPTVSEVSGVQLYLINETGREGMDSGYPVMLLFSARVQQLRPLAYCIFPQHSSSPGWLEHSTRLSCLNMNVCRCVWMCILHSKASSTKTIILGGPYSIPFPWPSLTSHPCCPPLQSVDAGEEAFNTH